MNIKNIWRFLSYGVFNGDDLYEKTVGLWNLDTGQEVATPKVLWEKMT